MSTWWQVYVNNTVFGFKTNNNSTSGTIYISDHPEREWKGERLVDYKQWLIKNKAQVIKIADLNE